MVVGGGEMTSADNVHSVLLAPEDRLAIEQALDLLMWLPAEDAGIKYDLKRLLQSVLYRQQDRMPLSVGAADSEQESEVPDGE